jgi:hypothetical protein
MPCSTDRSSQCSLIPTTTPSQSDKRLSELTELDGGVPALEAGIEHHLLGIVRPAFNKGG